MNELFEFSNRLINFTNNRFKRYLFNNINWNSRLIEINGARGVGKTTIMLQKAKELNSLISNQAIYISLDDPYFFKHNLIEVADEFVKYGGRYLFFDEIHKYPSKFKDFDWSSEIKNIYDKFPELRIIYSGSSILKLYKGLADLSRRRVVYTMAGLSLREYLEYNSVALFDPLNINTVFSSHVEITNRIVSKIKIIPHFKNYLKTGYYPFYNEAPEKYIERLKSVLNVILENDIPAVLDIPYETTSKLKKLLAVIASSVPYSPNLSLIRSELFISDQRTLLKYFDFLEKAELIISLGKQATGNQLLRKPEKIYLNNTNLIQCFDFIEGSIGTIRETFFINQLSRVAQIKYPPKGKGDFLINNNLTVEIGGKNKKSDQIAGQKNGYIVADDIETGYGNTIPLWLFGFLY